MSDQFISVVTDEAMARICYDGGWNLKPYKFYISQKDIFEGSTTQEAWAKKAAWDAGDASVREELKQEAFEYLQKVVTEDMQDDYTSGNVWYNARFSSITKANETTLVHHVNIPGDVAIDTTSKTIKTIYFIYQDNAGQDFLYALARCNGDLIFETGITQSFFFNFTVTNTQSQELTEFVLNYSCAHEIEDHNTTFGPEIHSNLVARDGSRSISGILKYANIDVSQFTDPDQLIPKKYVDQYIKDYLLPLIDNSVCPPGKLDWWPGAINTIPSGWGVRNGQLLTIADNPKLYQMFGQKYRNECRSGQNYDTSRYFPLMNDSGLFVRGSEMDGNGNVINTNYLSGVGFGYQQGSAVPNITGWISPHGNGMGGAFYDTGGGWWHGHRNNDGNIRQATFNASRSSSIYKDGVNEARPNNRNYLPIIKLG